ncbi:MAG: hypothetical protein EOO75_07680 [Myxococcales bacterium]|nr:MAG: hypothetical protein EOO75_07680 [Myxococcales bacterium]
MSPEAGEQPVEHVAAWRRFRRPVLERPAGVEPGMLVVWSFYSALHLVQAYLVLKGERFAASSHGQRRAALRSAPELRPLRASYALLQDASEQVRYEPAFVATEQTRDSALDALRRVESVLRGPLERALGPLEP